VAMTEEIKRKTAEDNFDISAEKPIFFQEDFPSLTKKRKV
jgi:hypothetical protein